MPKPCPRRQIDALGWLDDARPLLLIGETAVSAKTFITQAIGLHARASGKSVLYMCISAPQENRAIARSNVYETRRVIVSASSS
jgi:hypothetical protein